MNERAWLMDRFADRRALVTGAGSGIGQATVARLLGEGGTEDTGPAASNPLTI